MDYFRHLNDPIILEGMPIKRGVEIALTQKITVLVVDSDARMVDVYDIGIKPEGRNVVASVRHIELFRFSRTLVAILCHNEHPKDRVLLATVS
ncbi:uncharacterized protein G2W53_000717 [Senna tora]|uniref:Uncharacterized protein n=1 Tax=Senna tora TaxID=362788 RepID=A0A835CLX2_9FABA|nr:uncharacterized protein G2W53_000717 [Senna tora]